MDDADRKMVDVKTWEWLCCRETFHWNIALYGHGGLIAQQGHISLNTNLYLSQF